MVSSFYSNNEKKQRKYIKENKIRELNQEEQQQVVDSQTTFELAKDTKASNLSKLASRVVNKISSDLTPSSFNQTFTPLQNTPFQLLTDIIKAGKLTNLFNEMKTLPDSELNATQRFIRDRLNDPQFKSIMNENIAESAPLGDETIAETVFNTMNIDPANKEEAQDLVMKAISEKGYSVALGRERKKSGRKPKPSEEALKEAFEELETKRAVEEVQNAATKKIANKYKLYKQVKTAKLAKEAEEERLSMARQGLKKNTKVLPV